MGLEAQGTSTWIGRVLNGYRIDRKIGAGLTGTVYHAIGSGRTPAEVAIKVLNIPPDLTEKEYEEILARYTAEVEILKRLDHPNILHIVATGQEPGAPFGIPYFILPYIGRTLADALKNGRLDTTLAGKYLSQLATAVDAAHAAGVVHRDIKPQNILLADDTVYLADFSIARFPNGTHSSRTPSGVILGSLAYMAPEQISDARVGPSADIYSLGVVLYQMVTGRLPFVATDPSVLIKQQLQDIPPDPRTFCAGLSEPAAAVILKALAKGPGNRFENAIALGRAFAFALRGTWPTNVPQDFFTRQPTDRTSLNPPPTVQLPDPAATARRRTRLLLALAALLLIAMFAAILIPPLISRHVPGAGGASNTPPTSTTALALGSPTAQSNGPIATGAATATSTAKPRATATPHAGAPPKPAPTATQKPKPTATPTPKLSVVVLSCSATFSTRQVDLSSSPANPKSGSQRSYPPISVGNTGPGILSWSAVTNDASFPPDPASGNLGTGASKQVEFPGPFLSGASLTVTVSSNGGTWRGTLPPCSGF